MIPVDVPLAKQLLNASGLAYSVGNNAITASKYWPGSGLHDDKRLNQITVGIDSVLIGQTNDGVVVSFQGTMPPNAADPSDAIASADNWFNDFDLVLKTVSYSTGSVHTGFANSLDNLWAGLCSAIKSVYQNGGKILITGHSKGGALAALAAKRLIFENVLPAGVIPTAVFTFGAPRAGDEDFAAAYDAAMPNHWRFEHRNDIVPHLPPRPAVFELLKLLRNFPALSDLFNEITVPLGDYTSVGNLCFLDWSNQLEQDDTTLLEFEREGRLIIAGEELVTDHFVDAYISAM
jgi:hypothetical protein